jgi:outer membrane protein assembly factor BamC
LVKLPSKLAPKVALLSLPLALIACSSSLTQSDKVDYKSATQAPSLAVPPDLTQLPRDTRFNTPGGTVSATGFQNANDSANQNIISPTYPGMRIEGQGSMRWLVVDQPPEKLWPDLKSFWQVTGLTVTSDDQKLGIIDTDWAENRAKLPRDFIQRSLGSIIDNMASTGTLDQYRMRVERNAQGGTEIYISHRGVEEVYKDETQTRTIWQPRPADPELEVEMLRRLMIKLGASAKQAENQLQTAQVRQTSQLVARDGSYVVEVSESFDRAWRRVGLTLDRTGFTVEDRDRSQGLYFVRYVEPKLPGQEEPGFWAKLFGNTPKDKTPQKYRVFVRGEGEKSIVSVLDTEGKAESSDNAQRILKVVTDDLR